jgi:hypothetical protein
MNATLLTDIVLGATGAPWPAVPQPARVKAAASTVAAAHRVADHPRRRIRLYPDVTLCPLHADG